MRAAPGLVMVAMVAAAGPVRAGVLHADFFDDVRRTFKQDIPRTFQHDIPHALGFQGKPASPARAPVKSPKPAPAPAPAPVPDQRT